MLSIVTGIFILTLVDLVYRIFKDHDIMWSFLRATLAFYGWITALFLAWAL